MLGNIEGKRIREKQRMRWPDGTLDSKDMSLSKLWETVKDRNAWHAAVCEVTKIGCDWTTTTTDRHYVVWQISLKHVLLAWIKLCAHWTTPHSPPPTFWQLWWFPLLLLSLSMLDSSCKWSHAVFVVLGLAYFTQHSVHQVHPCCCIW